MWIATSFVAYLSSVFCESSNSGRNTNGSSIYVLREENVEYSSRIMNKICMGYYLLLSLIILNKCNIIIFRFCEFQFEALCKKEGKSVYFMLI